MELVVHVEYPGHMAMNTGIPNTARYRYIVYPTFGPNISESEQLGKTDLFRVSGEHRPIPQGVMDVMTKAGYDIQHCEVYLIDPAYIRRATIGDKLLATSSKG